MKKTTTTTLKRSYSACRVILPPTGEKVMGRWWRCAECGEPFQPCQQCDAVGGLGMDACDACQGSGLQPHSIGSRLHGTHCDDQARIHADELDARLYELLFETMSDRLCPVCLGLGELDADGGRPWMGGRVTGIYLDVAKEKVFVYAGEKKRHRDEDGEECTSCDGSGYNRQHRGSN